MNTTDSHPLVVDYLRRLEAAAWPLAPDRRAELGGEVREHIEAALEEEGRRDEATIRNVLDRLGAPQEIVAAEATRDARGAPIVVNIPRQPESVWGPLEIAAILLLTIGAVLLPVFGPLVGLVLVWLSSRLGTREKVVATLIFVLLVVVPILGLMAFTSGGVVGSGSTAP